MSNIENDPRMRNGWAEYQRLVLAELERHNKLIEAINVRIGEIQLSQALLRQENGKLGKLEQRIDDNEKRLDKMDAGSQIDQAIAKYRKWLLSGGFLILTAVIVPVIKLFFGGS